jgi:hypothetical protein
MVRLQEDGMMRALVFEMVDGLINPFSIAKATK